MLWAFFLFVDIDSSEECPSGLFFEDSKLFCDFDFVFVLLDLALEKKYHRF
jgi:hypothetical protein